MSGTCESQAAGIGSVHFRKFCQDRDRAIPVRRQCPSFSRSKTRAQNALWSTHSPALLFQVAAIKMREEKDRKMMGTTVGLTMSGKKTTTRTFFAHFYDTLSLS
jgi:hypothetical protein